MIKYVLLLCDDVCVSFSPVVPFRRLSSPLGLAAGVVPCAASILGTSLLSQLPTVRTTSLALAAHAPKGGEGAGFGRWHPAARLARGCHQAVGRRGGSSRPAAAAAAVVGVVGVVRYGGACSVR